MSKQEWTKERLKIRKKKNWKILTESGFNVANATLTKGGKTGVWPVQTGTDNAKRIVECWNACFELDNPSEYISSLRQENERLRESLITFSGQFRAIKDLTKERKPRLKQIAKAAEMGVLAVRSVLDGADVVEAARQALTKEG